MAASWGEGKGAAPLSDWSPKRFGADPPEVLEALRSSVGQAVLSACGVPVALATDADGTAARAAWARFVQSSCAGTARIVASELRRKLGVEVEIDFSRLFAHDVTGRAGVRDARESGRDAAGRRARGMRDLGRWRRIGSAVLGFTRPVSGRASRARPSWLSVGNVEFR